MGDVSIGIQFGTQRIQTLCVIQAFFHGLDQFFMVARISRGLPHTLAISQRDPAPGLNQGDKIRGFSAFLRAFPFLANGAPVGKKFFENFRVFGRKSGTHFFLPAALGHLLITLKDFFNLTNVIGLHFGGSIHRCETTTNDHCGQAYLQIGETALFPGTSQLQGHEEITGLTHAPRQTFAHRNHSGQTRTRGNTDMIKPQRPGIFQGDGATQTHAPENLKPRTPG